MRFIHLVFYCILLVTSITTLQADETVKTVAGTFQVVSDSDGIYQNRITLNGRILKRYDSMFVRIEKKYRLRNSTLILLSEDYGGSGTRPSYYFLEFSKNGSVRIGGPVDSNDYTFKPRQIDKETVEVDLGYEKGRHKYAIYSHGKLHIQKRKEAPRGLSDKECFWLYDNVYNVYIRKSRTCDKDIYFVLGNGPFHTYDALEQNPSFRKQAFTKLAQHSCRKRRPVSYRTFKNRICRQR